MCGISAIYRFTKISDDDLLKLKEMNHQMSYRGVPQLLAKWDAFLYSANHDTFGIAVVEAIAS